MARKTATTKGPARAPRKANRASQGNQKAGARQQPATGRRTAKTARPARPNPFDDIARQVIADQEAKDRAAGRADLTPTVATSFDKAKAKRSGTSRTTTKPTTPARPATPTTATKPVRPTKVQGNRMTFTGRPTSNPETIAARAKQLGLRVRKDADPADIAARLRATVPAVAAWLETRNGSPVKAMTMARPGAKAPTKAKPKGPKSEWVTEITLQHPWAERQPDYLRNRTLVIRYQRKADGTVWATLTQLREADGSLVPNFKDYPLDYRPIQERDSRNRPVVLKGDLDQPALRDWLLKKGIASPRDIETSS